MYFLICSLKCSSYLVISMQKQKGRKCATVQLMHNELHLHHLCCQLMVPSALGICQHLSEHICGKSYGEVMGWLRASWSFAIIRATNLCLWGLSHSVADLGMRLWGRGGGGDGRGEGGPPRQQVWGSAPRRGLWPSPKSFHTLRFKPR